MQTAKGAQSCFKDERSTDDGLPSIPYAVQKPRTGRLYDVELSCSPKLKKEQMINVVGAHM